MNGFSMVIRVDCCCPEGGHDTVVFRTATSGLVVGQWAHRSDNPDPELDARWTILHHATGLVLPLDFGDPESAMACAQALAAVGDWRDVDPTYDMAAALEILRQHAGESAGYTDSGLRELRNEVPA